MTWPSCAYFSVQAGSGLGRRGADKYKSGIGDC